MPKDFFPILGRKTWPTVNEPALRKDIAAFHWLQTGHTLAQTQGLATLRSALFSKMAMHRMLLCRRSDKEHFLCLGNAHWGTLLWPVQGIGAWNDGELCVFRVDPASTVQLAHIDKPEDWEEIPYEPAQIGIALVPTQGIVMMRTGEAQSLPRACLGRVGHGLGYEDLMALAEHLQATVRERSRKGALEAILRVIAPGDENFARLVLDVDMKEETLPAEALITDPEVEATFEELPDEDKK